MPYTMDNIKKRGYILEFFHIPSGRSVTFRALITAFRDAFSSNWQSTSVYGRQDQIETFQNTTRKISFSWKTVSEDEHVAQKNLEDASLLYSMLYPTYSGNGENAATISTSPVLKLRFANLIQNTGGSSVTPGPVSAKYVGGGLVGRSGGFTFEPSFEEEGFFDYANGRLLPKTINFSCEFTVYHTHPVGWREDGTFIAAKFPYGEKHGGTGLSKAKSGSGGSPNVFSDGGGMGVKEQSSLLGEIFKNQSGGTSEQKTAKQNTILKR